MKPPVLKSDDERMDIMKQLKWLGAIGAASALSAAGVAQAGNVYWSVGVHQPGVHVGVINTSTVVVQYPVVVHAPRRLVVAPPPHRVGWLPPGHRYHPPKHHVKDARPKQQQVTHVHHHHHYHTSPAPQVMYAAPPVRPYWR